MSKFAGKTAFITGGASGMGFGMAKVFAQAGMRVAIADIRRDALATAMDELGSTNLAIRPVHLDVTDRSGWQEAIRETEDLFGNIHVLVANAGVGIVGPIEAATPQDWDFSLDVNLTGVFNGIHAVLPRIRHHGEGGHIVATSSTAGVSAVGDAGLYSAAKFGVAGLMETLATELAGSNIGVSVFFPGPAQTNLGTSTAAIRPRDPRDGETAPVDTIAPNEFDDTVFMTPVEVGVRVLNGMERGDLFIMSHPEFRDSVRARGEALLRAFPDEPPAKDRIDVLRQFGTLLYNPTYDTQKPVPGQSSQASSRRE